MNKTKLAFLLGLQEDGSGNNTGPSAPSRSSPSLKDPALFHGFPKTRKSCRPKEPDSDALGTLSIANFIFRTMEDEVDYSSLVKASLDALERVLSETASAVESLRMLCADLDKCPSRVKATSDAVQLHDRLINSSDGVCTMIKDYVSFHAVSNVEISWLGSETSKLDMKYVIGDNPWEFFLSHSSNVKLEGIYESLKEKHKQNTLKAFFVPPKEGQFVISHTGKKLFRAQVLKCSSNGRFRVLNIDSYEEVLVQLNNIYQVPLEIAAIPCQTIRCCLSKEDQYLSKWWSRELELIFKKTLSECQLTVDILEKLNCFHPPKFHVRIYVYNDEVQEEINLSSWINKKLLAKLKLLLPDSVEDVLDVLDEECLDPFYPSNSSNRLCSGQSTSPTLNLNPDASSFRPVSENFVVASSNSVPDVVEGKSHVAEAPAKNDGIENLDEPDPLSIGESVQKVCTWMKEYSDEETIKANQKTAKYQKPPKLEEPSFLISKAKTSLRSDVAEVGLAADKIPATLANGTQAACSSNTSITSKASSSKQSNKKSAVSCKMSVDAPEFVPFCYVDVVPGTNEESFENVISNLEDEYQPKDERRICRLYQKKGFCNRIACDKEHTKGTDRWTDDVVEIERGPFNNIDLPREGCETIIRVQVVESANTFFSTLHEIYSDINEYGVRETLESLYRDLNSCEGTSPHPLLETMPVMAEMVLALGLQRTLGPKRKWLRAIVTEILDPCTVEVFFSDFGNKEIVPLKDLRQIRPQFLHLPSQAVRTMLASLQLVPEQRKAGKAFLAKLIKGATCKAKVVSRNVIEAEMEVILFTEDETCVNNLMVDKGFCLPF